MGGFLEKLVDHAMKLNGKRGVVIQSERKLNSLYDIILILSTLTH